MPLPVATQPASTLIQLPPGKLIYDENPWVEVSSSAAAPLIICLTILGILAMFRASLGTWISRWNSVKTPWATVNAAGEQPPNPPDSPSKIIEPPAPPPRTPGDAATTPSSESAASSDAGRETRDQGDTAVDKDREIERLKSEVLQLRRYGWFERLYGYSYGSQLVFLISLDTDGSRDHNLTLPFYQASQNIGNKQTFEQWIGFLLNARLVEISAPQQYQITQTGRDLVQFMKAAKLTTTAKPF